MADLLTLENATNLLMLCFLQAVLGFDNLLYISIESQRAPVAQQRAVRFWGIIIAVALRVILLFAMVSLIAALEAPFYVFDFEGILSGGVNFATIVYVIGGVFIMYTAVKEISHMLSIDRLGHDVEGKSARSAVQVVALIVTMNLIFSFDSVLSAIAITDVFPVLAAAILLSGAAMLLLADGVTRFLQKNRMYEVLGLFILLIVGVLLLGEGGHVAHMHLFGYEIVPMSKSTFYFSIARLFVVNVIQTQYQKKLQAKKRIELERLAAKAA